MTLAKNIELNGQQLSFEDIPYLKLGSPIMVSAINEEGENTCHSRSTLRYVNTRRLNWSLGI